VLLLAVYFEPLRAVAHGMLEVLRIVEPG